MNNSEVDVTQDNFDGAGEVSDFLLVWWSHPIFIGEAVEAKLIMEELVMEG